MIKVMLDKERFIKQPPQVPGYMREAPFFPAVLQPSHFSRTGTTMCLPYPRYCARRHSPQAAGTNPCSPHIPEEEAKAESGCVTCSEAPSRQVGGFVPGQSAPCILPLLAPKPTHRILSRSEESGIRDRRETGQLQLVLGNSNTESRVL